MNSLNNLPDPTAISRYLKGFDFFERYVHGQWEGNLYVDTHARRFVETLRLLPKLPPGARVLELGAIPYYLTILLEKFCGLVVDPLSFYEFEEAEETIHIVENSEFREHYAFRYVPLNVEKDVFQLPDDAYDLVLCCEILEHLLINPSHMLYEIHRVLRPGGYLLVSTPNVVRWGNVFSLLRGRNIYDCYHGNGIYGRHNREYSMSEVAQLLEANGFTIKWIETRNVYGQAFLNKVPIVLDNRRDSIFALARATKTPRAAFPSNLYTLMDEHRNVIRPTIQMGENEIGQIGRGWYDVEIGTAPFRWTAKEAEFFLKSTGGGRLKLSARTDNPKVRTEPINVSVEVNGRELEAQTLNDDAWHDVSYEIARAGTEDILRCKLKVSETWVPKNESGSSDSRELGVSVSRIWLE